MRQVKVAYVCQMNYNNENFGIFKCRTKTSAKNLPDKISAFFYFSAPIVMILMTHIKTGKKLKQCFIEKQNQRNLCSSNAIQPK